MKLNKYIIVIILALGFCFDGCNQKDTIEPIGELIPKYSVPQGVEEYDKKIVSFYNDYGSMILYNYDTLDALWNVTTLVPSVANPYHIVPIEEVDIDICLNMLFEDCFTLYPEEFLKKTLPRYIFLANMISTSPSSISYKYYSKTKTNLTFGYMNRESIMDVSMRQKLKAGINMGYIEYCISIGVIVVPEAFVEGISYGNLSYSNYKNLGIIHSTYYNLTSESDFLYSLKAILEGTEFSLNEIFNDDPEGNRKRRCAILVDEMKRIYGIDLEKLCDFDLPHQSELQ